MSEGPTTAIRLRVARADEIPPGDFRRIEGDHQPVAVYNVGGEFHAVDDTCTHEKYPLTEGWIEDDTVECALHMAKFCISTGKALCLPAARDLATHSVDIVDGEVWVVITKETA